MPGGHVVVEPQQSGLAEDQARRLGRAIVEALERRALAEEDETGRVVGEKPHVARVALAFERGQQWRKVDKGSLQRVVEHLTCGNRDWLAAVLRLRAMLHATSRLWCFHLSFRFSMLFPLASRFWSLGRRFAALRG